jgi:hypothetical protein
VLILLLIVAHSNHITHPAQTTNSKMTPCEFIQLDLSLQPGSSNNSALTSCRDAFQALFGSEATDLDIVGRLGGWRSIMGVGVGVGPVGRRGS